MASPASPTEHSLELPLDVIKASTGFSFDIGGSVAKLVYRSKEDFENGEPKNKDKAATGMGTVRMTLIAREKLGDVLDYIKEHCDITSDENGESIVYSTGVGGNEFKTRIEEGLGVQLKNLAEFDCFAEACCLLLKTKPSTEVFKPKNQVGLDQAAELMKVFDNFRTATEAGGIGRMDTKQEADLEPYDPDTDARFPFLLTMVGSGMAFLVMEEDGTYILIDGAPIAGRFFLGLVSYLTDIRDFDEIARLIEQSDGRTVDNYVSDLVDQTTEDVYSSFQAEFRIFPFGKGLTEARDKSTKGDLIHSLLETICDNTAQLANQMAQCRGVPRVYFVGNFVNMPKAERFITRAMRVKQYQPGLQVNYEFLQHGGFMGAIGAFCKTKGGQKDSKKGQEGKK